MKTVRHRSRSGFTLVGLMVSISITAIVALGAAYIIISSQKVNSFGNAQNEIDRIQYLNLQLSRNPAFILRQPAFAKGGPLYQCLQHSGPVGVDCTRLPAPAPYVSESKVTGTPTSVMATIDFQPNCKIPQACESLTITTTTGLKQTSQGSILSPTVGHFQTRRSTTIIPSYILVPATGFNFSCVMSQGMITALNYANSQAVCQPLTGTLATVTEPLANFGPLTPTTTQNMTKQNCTAHGFASIGPFQDQTACMVPTVTTTTTMAPPVPPGAGGGGGGGGGGGSPPTTLKAACASAADPFTYGNYTACSSSAPPGNAKCVSGTGTPMHGTNYGGTTVSLSTHILWHGIDSVCSYSSFLPAGGSTGGVGGSCTPSIPGLASGNVDFFNTSPGTGPGLNILGPGPQYTGVCP